MIKILQNTPSHSKNTIISINDFRKHYPTVINENNSDEFLLNYIKQEYKNDSLDIDYSKWFEVIENKFKIGDWVFNESSKKAYVVVHKSRCNSFTKEWRPNYITLEAANEYQSFYKRLATEEEIKYYDLHSFCNGSVLIGNYKCYYFNSVWKELKNVKSTVAKYLEYANKFSKIDIQQENSIQIEYSYKCNPNGLEVGCNHISHEYIMIMAKVFNIN